jgi:hypothetical protein
MIQMQNDFLSQVEKNIEVQAAGLIAVEREDRAFSEARGELAQIELTDRLRAKANEDIYFQLKKLGWFKGQLKQVFADHFLVATINKLWLVPLSSLLAVSGLTRAMKKPNPIEARWNQLSSYRDWVIDQTQVRVQLIDGESIYGELLKLYKDHFELKTQAELVAINYSSVLVAMRNYES